MSLLLWVVGASRKGFGSILEVIRATGKCILLLLFFAFLLQQFACPFFLQVCAFFLYFFTSFMAQSRARGKGQRKGKNVPIGDAPPVPISLGSASVPSIGSGDVTKTSNVEGIMNLEIQ